MILHLIAHPIARPSSRYAHPLLTPLTGFVAPSPPFGACLLTRGRGRGGSRWRWRRRIKRLPFQSSADHTCHPSDNKPGRHVLEFFRHYKTLCNHIIFALLRGRTVVVLGDPSHETNIRALITTLWVFVPGHSTQQQVVAWRGARPLRLADLSRIRLIGLSKAQANGVPHTVSRYVSVLDFEKETLQTPAYSGHFVKMISEPSRHWRSNSTCLAHIHNVFLQMAAKAFLYYHLHCLHTTGATTPTPDRPQQSAQRFMTDHGIHGCDVAIVQYLTETVKMQQALDYRRAAGQQFDGALRHAVGT